MIYLERNFKGKLYVSNWLSNGPVLAFFSFVHFFFEGLIPRSRKKRYELDGFMMGATPIIVSKREMEREMQASFLQICILSFREIAFTIANVPQTFQEKRRKPFGETSHVSYYFIFYFLICKIPSNADDVFLCIFTLHLRKCSIQALKILLNIQKEKFFWLKITSKRERRKKKLAKNGKKMRQEMMKVWFR